MKKITLTFNQVVLLHDAFYTKELPCSGPYYDLLRAHCIDFCLFFQKLMERGCSSYRVKFTALQAVAFLQLWLHQELPLNNSSYLILELIAEFDQAHKNTRVLL